MAFLGSASRPFDVLVIGSGATGGIAAKRLTENGMKVALLEAGRRTSASEFADMAEYERKRQTPPPSQIGTLRPIQVHCYACRGEKHQWFVNDIENPYLQLKPYHWIRMRILGGRLLAWAGHCYRLSDLDFKAASRDGYGEDWPISYRDLVSYYDEIEGYLGVTGRPERLAQLPDGLYLPPAETNLTERILRHSTAAAFNRVVTPARLATMTCRDTRGNIGTSLSDGFDSKKHQFSSPWKALTDAGDTGRLTLLSDAVVARVLMKDSRAAGLQFVDCNTRNVHEVFGKCIVLCASTLESTRILLNSGICNSSGVLGRYLMDHIYGASASGCMEVDSRQLRAGLHENHRIYIPRFRNLETSVTDGFIRGYGYQGKLILDESSDYFYSASKTDFTRVRAKVILSAFGECLAREENFVEIDPQRVDEWGIPTLKVHAEWSTNELRLSRDASAEAVKILDAAGVGDVTMEGRKSVPGLCAHEIGTARMGNDPSRSVVNRFCQAHDVQNLFVTDGACWVSSACQNPTLTMMAITLRTCDYILREAFRTFR